MPLKRSLLRLSCDHLSQMFGNNTRQRQCTVTWNVVGTSVAYHNHRYHFHLPLYPRHIVTVIIIIGHYDLLHHIIIIIIIHHHPSSRSSLSSSSSSPSPSPSLNVKNVKDVIYHDESCLCQWNRSSHAVIKSCWSKYLGNPPNVPFFKWPWVPELVHALS